MVDQPAAAGWERETLSQSHLDDVKAAQVWVAILLIFQLVEHSAKIHRMANTRSIVF